MKFVAYTREQQGTGASRRLRITGKVPGIVFGAKEPQMIEIDHNALFHALKKEAFHSSILEMELGSAVEQVILRDVQMHPFKQQVLHVDFQRVDASTRIRKKVPLHFVGEDVSQAVKLEGCSINHVLKELEIECLAQKLPEFLNVDVTTLTKGQSLHVDDLKLDAGIKVVLHGKKNPVVATVAAPLVEDVAEVAAAPVAAAAPAKGKAKKEEKKGDKK